MFNCSVTVWGVADECPAVQQLIFLTGPQLRSSDLFNLKPKRLDAAFLLRLVHGQRVNFLFDAAKLFVDHIISIVRRLVLRKGIQNTQMPRQGSSGSDCRAGHEC